MHLQEEIMRKQYAVLGLSRFGESLAVTLQSLGCDVVVMDANETKVHDIADKVSYAMIADVENPATLKMLETRNLDGIMVTITENMEASIMATLLSKEMGVPFVMAVAKNEAHARVLEKVGADDVILPERESGVRVAKNLVSANFAEWISLSGEYSIVEMPVPKEWIGKNLIELDIRKKLHVNIVAKKCGKKIEVNLLPDVPLNEEDSLIVIGANRDLGRLPKTETK